MAEIKVSALPAATAPNGTEVVPVVQGGVTKRLPVGAAGGLATLLANGKLDPAQSTTITGTAGMFIADSRASTAGGRAVATLAAGDARFVAFWLDKIEPVNRILVEIITAAGNIDVGIYESDGSNGSPGTRLVSTGSMVCPPAGAVAITLPTTTLDPARKYFAALAGDTGTLQILYYGEIMRWPVTFAPAAAKAAAFPLPAAAGATSADATGNIFDIRAGRA